MSHPLPDPLRVLAVSADDARHAPVRALLKGSVLEHVTTHEQALNALDARHYDVVLVDREIDPPGSDGLLLAERLVTASPHTPVIVLSHQADRAADAEAAEHGIADFLVVPGLSRDRLEHAIRYALTHQRTLQKLQASEQRHALAMAGANDGLWDWDVVQRHGLLLPALEEHARLPRARGGRDARRVARPRPRRRPRPAHAGARRLRARRQPPSTSSSSTACSTATAATAGISRAGSRSATARRPPASSAASPTSPTAARPSIACSTTRSTTR